MSSSKNPKRIYKIRAKNGKKELLVSARSRTQALRWVMEEYFVSSIATHEELMEHFKTEGSEIIDVSDPEQTEIPIEPDISGAGNPSTGGGHKMSKIELPKYVYVTVAGDEDRQFLEAAASFSELGELERSRNLSAEVSQNE